MKKILITGENSYIGTSVEKWLNRYPNKYFINTISVRGDSWKQKDFSGYDTVLHVAGIAHIRETKKNALLYYKVNRDLTIEIAKKAKKDGIEHFIFLSTMSVYGLETGVINEYTPLKPNSHYGRSKLQAEKAIKKLEDNNFKIAIIRPPMVYGKGCKGNYKKLSKFARITPVFPEINNKRSMIYIDNLSEYIRYIIDNKLSGIFLPQNKEYVNTTYLVQQIAKQHGKKIKPTKIFNPLILLLKSNSLIKKVFGNLVYDFNIPSNQTFEKINIISLEESIKLTEK